ncbi:uncharacterized protein cubi_01738 [Cryptosporidium ubiquitum]|uniref:Uncharacterized protein n=1 Tax=Cryptosporidium ubiquitum TaxID=857276 RepID=A0A1J4MBA0_9CRYT|nr:uncharacterized protein cubi_01738 [Cryptosporidium ubiquitum]OII71263.1 hypothetical protein cubi_01738 [Cryptosporidium ubiquitum]
MISDSNFSIYHIHHLEKVLDEKELKSWDSDINHILPDTDDAFEVNIIDSIQLYQKEAIETQLSTIEKLVNLDGMLSTLFPFISHNMYTENENDMIFSNNTINLNNVISFLDQNSNITDNNNNHHHNHSNSNLNISSSGNLNNSTTSPILRSTNL